MRPHLVRWQEDYAEQGLIVIEVTGGEQEPLSVVKEIVERQRLNHPVLWDSQWRIRRKVRCANRLEFGATIPHLVT